MSAADYTRRQQQQQLPPPADESDLFYRPLPQPPAEVSGEDDGQELELGLTLGGPTARCFARRRYDDNDARSGAEARSDRCRILTAMDFPTAGHGTANPPTASTSSVSSSSSSSVATGGVRGRGGAAAVRNGTAGGVGTKRAAEPDSPEALSTSPSRGVVGWPPLRAYRVNNLTNTAKQSPSTRYSNVPGQNNGDHLACCCPTKSAAAAQENVAAAEEQPEKRKTSAHLVKVNMDGMAIGRKVDLGVHNSYTALALALEDMFQKTPILSHTRKTSKLLDGSSDFALTYEDKDGDWMLVGDVPWGMFLNTVRRLRIMRTCDANVLAPGFQTTNGLRGIHK